MKNDNKEYYSVLSKDIPLFLIDYLSIEELQRIDLIGMNCGTDYTRLFSNKRFYSRLDHSIGVALIIWKFTNDKKQTIAGLLHDIATPSFSHCIDFLHEDYIKQETTEKRTKEIIVSSQRLLNQLQKDNILAEEIYDYKKYPIADNPTPHLSADRLEYTLSSGMTFTKVWGIDDIRKIYLDIEVFQNEDGYDELGFKTQEIAETFVIGASKMWYIFQGNKDKFVMQFWADIIAFLIHHNVINEDSLYCLSEKELIDIINKCGNSDIRKALSKFQKAKIIYEDENKPNGVYAVSINTKKRFINPLVCGVRLTDLSEKISRAIDTFMSYHSPKYCWLDFDLQEQIFL